MRNTLQEQYNLLKEGKMNKQHFFKSARHLFPDLITSTNSFTDAVTILKNRGIISEGIGGLVTTGKKQDWHAIFKENMASIKEEKEVKVGDIIKHKSSGAEFKVTKISDNNIEGKYTKVGDLEGKVQVGDINKTNKNLIGKTYDLLSEAKEAKAIEKETTKEVTDMATRGYNYKDEKNYDNVFGQEFLQGYYTEMKDPKNADKHVDELRAIVAKNLAKDINHYVKDGQFGTKGVGYTTEAPGLGTPKEAKGKFKSSGYGDLKESVLRLAIQDIIKEVLTEDLDKDSIKKEGEDAKEKAMKRRITNEIVRRKKKMKALQTLTELDGEENDDNAKKIKGLQSEIKQLEGMMGKLDKKKVKEANEKTAIITNKRGKRIAVDYTNQNQLADLKNNSDLEKIETGDGNQVK